MTTGMRTIIFPVKDIDRAKAVYAGLLGVQPTMDEAYYVGFDVAGQHVGLDPNGHSKGLTGPIAYWHVDDIRRSVAGFLEAGGSEQEAVHDVGGGRLVASVLDADGNLVGLLQEG